MKEVLKSETDLDRFYLLFKIIPRYDWRTRPDSCKPSDK